MAERILVTSIGTGQYSEVTYRLGDRTWSTQFAPAALARLLPLAGHRALVLVTREARQRWYDPLAEELREAGLTVEPVDVPLGRSENEILEIFSTLAERVPAGSDLSLDVTFALRHLPFVYLASLGYLQGLRGVRVSGAFYGAYDLRNAEREREAPIIDITPLLQLLDWAYAVRAFATSGSVEAVASQMSALVGSLFRAGERPIALSHAKDAARRLALPLAEGLLLEAGREAAALCTAAGDLAQSAGSPAARLALQALADSVAHWQRPLSPDKASIPLDAEELGRQLRLARWYLERGRMSVALGVLREWLVSAMILASGDTARWLDYGSRRKPMEAALNALGERTKRGVAAPREAEIASLWRSVADLRNKLAHVGMNEQWVSPSLRQVQALLDRCEGAGADFFCLPGAPSATMLITPLGLSPGVLYSATVRVQPDQLIVLTSAAARPRIAEALARAQCAVEPLVIELREPHVGFREVADMLSEDLLRAFVAVSRIVVNLTGGTTVMQYAAERLAAAAQQLGVLVQRVALVDRRPPAAQTDDPWRLGELVELDGD
jgi:hypothetical protein